MRSCLTSISCVRLRSSTWLPPFRSCNWKNSFVLPGCRQMSWLSSSTTLESRSSVVMLMVKRSIALSLTV